MTKEESIKDTLEVIKRALEDDNPKNINASEAVAIFKLIPNTENKECSSLEIKFNSDWDSKSYIGAIKLTKIISEIFIKTSDNDIIAEYFQLFVTSLFIT